jgi:aarF domain-containing kinase
MRLPRPQRSLPKYPRYPPSSRERIGIFGGALAGAFGVAVYVYRDEVRHGLGAIERSARVLGALAVCINEYRVALNAVDATTDEHERARLLRECHRRCAERTLRVLERNGSIFIKLGQHLVRLKSGSVVCRLGLSSVRQ